MNCAWLDVVWNAILSASLISAALTLFMWMLTRLSGLNATHLKWVLNINYLVLLGAVGASFISASLFNPDLNSACFAEFIGQTGSFSFTRSLAVSWLVITSLLLVRDFAVSFATFQSIKNLPGLLSEEVEKLKSRMQIKRDILFKRGGNRAFVFGVRQMIIVVPDAVLNSEHVQAVVAHELAHAHDRDTFWSMLECICRRIFFFNPLLCLLRSEYHLAVEKSADERAGQRAQISNGAIANAMVALLDKAQTRSVPVTLEAASGFKNAKKRLEYLASRNKKDSKKKLILISVFSVLGGFSTAWAELDLRPQLAPRCEQLEIERVFEAWLKTESTQNRCEEANK